MHQYQPMETSSLIICRVIFENILVEVYEVLVNVILKLHSNSCGKNINLSNDEWVVIFIHFDIISQAFPLYFQVNNMVKIMILKHKLLIIFPLGSFS